MTKKIDAAGAITRYEYDDADRLKTLTDANGNSTTFTYDSDGNLLTEKRADGATWSYTRDENFNRKTITDPNGTVVTFVYDDLDRLIEKQIARGSGVAGPSRVTMILDELGRTTEASTDEGVVERFAYDSLDRQISESVQIGSGPARTFSRSYDPSGNLVGLTYPSGLQLRHDIDRLDRIAAIRDAAGTTPVVVYSDLGGRLATKTLASGMVETWSYDPNRRLAGIASRIGSATAREVQYQRSRAGDKLAAIRPDLQKQSAFTYNANHWMTGESMGILLTGEHPQPALTVGYDIDRALNFRSITRTANDAPAASTTPFTINSRNQYTSIGTEPLGYDRNGNLTGRDGIAIQYDYENRLQKATLAGGPTIDNLYDASGRKVEEKITSGGTIRTTDYALSGDQVKEEYTGGTLTRRYIHGREIDEIVRADLGGTTIYPLQDELGNVERLTDASGTTLERYEYEGYGHFTVFNPSNGQLTASALGWKWLFQGREYQPALGAHDFRARTLWPDLGRFGQEDPAKGHGETSPYEALLGSPVNLSDPKGLYEEDVHHYLTTYLARAAGLEPSLAEAIGYEAGHLDFDSRDAMHHGVDHSNMQNYHFVSEQRLAQMRGMAMTSIQSKELRAVGEYIHALEDSYSHQANTDHRDFAAQYHDQAKFVGDIGHAYEGHDPDLTFLRPELTFAMAKDTQEQLIAICRAYRHASRGTCRSFSWECIKEHIAPFIVDPVPLFTDVILKHEVPTVVDYSGKVAKLRGFLTPEMATTMANYEVEPRRKAYQEYLARTKAKRQAQSAPSRTISIHEVQRP